MKDTPKDEWVEVDRLKLHYRDWGGAGQPIVLLHGLASTCRIWDLVAPVLSDGFRVVALDQRGHGQSDKPDLGYDFDSVVGDLHGFAVALGLERPVVVGHSWGADVALDYAVAHPGLAKGLCFVDGGTFEISSGKGMTLERAKEELAPPDFTGWTMEELKERSRSWQRGRLATRRAREIMLANFEVLEDKTVRARLRRENHMRLIEAMWSHRPSQLYGRVKCPVLLMPARQRGEQNPRARRFRREEGIALATRLLPKSKTVWLENSVHDVPLQRPKLVARTIGDHIRKGFFS